MAERSDPWDLPVLQSTLHGGLLAILWNLQSTGSIAIVSYVHICSLAGLLELEQPPRLPAFKSSYCRSSIVDLPCGHWLVRGSPRAAGRQPNQQYN